MSNFKKGLIVVIVAILIAVFLWVVLPAFAFDAYNVSINKNVSCGAGQKTFSGTGSYQGDSSTRLIVTWNPPGSNNISTVVDSTGEPSTWSFNQTVVVGGTYTIEGKVWDNPTASGNPEDTDSWTFTIEACSTPTLTLTPTAIPTATPTPTVTPTITPTPTIDPCNPQTLQIVSKLDVAIDPCVTPTPVEPTPTETPKDEPKGDDRGDYHPTEAKAPQPVVCTIPFEIPKVWYTKTNGKVNFHWATDEQGIQKFSVVFGFSPDALIYGVDNIPAESRVLEDVKGLTGKVTYFQVWSWKYDCAMKSEVIDP